MFTGIFEPAFLQAASAHATPEPPVEENEIVIGTRTKPNTFPVSLSCTGEITVIYTAGGEQQTKTFTDLEDEILTGVIPDANTNVKITGNVTRFQCGGPNSACILSIDFSKCKTLTAIAAITGDWMTSLIMPDDDTLITQCEEIELESVNTIKCKADNQIVCNGIAAAISYATGTGTLYTDSAGAYFSTLDDAASDKGWTIEQL